MVDVVQAWGTAKSSILLDCFLVVLTNMNERPFLDSLNLFTFQLHHSFTSTPELVQGAGLRSCNT